MKPKKNTKTDFIAEPVPTEEWLNASIEEVEYEAEHQFGGMYAKLGEAIRLKFRLEPFNGKKFEQLKFSRWLSFSYAEKANLYKMYLKPLVKNAKPFFDFDVQSLKGVKCRLMFQKDTSEDGKDYYNVLMVRPLNGQVEGLPTIQVEEPIPFENSDEQLPF